MRRIGAVGLAVAAVLATPLLAASRVTVQQLAQMLNSAHASRRSDDGIAREIAFAELTERLTEATLSGLSQGQGERTKRALQILADESAFLDPPVSELPTGGPPDLPEQRAILAKASEYALAYMRDLPNLTCTQTRRRLDDDPFADKTKTSVVGLLSDQDTSAWDIQARANITGRLRERDKIVSVLTFDNHEAPTAEFGSLMRSVFSRGIAENAAWSHWETIDGKRVAAFHYSVGRADSDFFLNACCVEGQGHWSRENLAYRGALFVEPASGAVVRITLEAVDLPASSPTGRSDTAIEYRAVSIGGGSWLCPARTVTVSDHIVTEYRKDAVAMPILVRSLSEVEFAGHRGSSAKVVVNAPAAAAPLLPVRKAGKDVVTVRAVTVQQLVEMLKSANGSRHADDDIARVELTERLTDVALASLTHGQGKRTKATLRILADESALLDPPASELPAEPPPAVTQQKAIMAHASDYALAYIRDLPNFTCTQTTRRLDTDPSRQAADIAGLLSDPDSEAMRALVAAYPRRLSERDTVVSTLTYDHGAESHRHVRTSVASSPKTMQGSMQGLATSGEFGGMIESIFSPNSAAKALWGHWETMDGKLAAVFNYAVDLAHSDFFLYWCCLNDNLRKERVAYRGQLFIEPESGVILRVSWQAVDVPPTLPMRSSATVVDYRAVDIGGTSWLCPVRSVTISDSTNVYHAPSNERYVRSLNEVAFTGYRKFSSTSTFVAGP